MSGAAMAGTALRRAVALLAVAVVLPVVAAVGSLGSGPISGGAATRSAFDGWLRRWREHYVEGLTAVPEVPQESLPAALRGVQPKVFEDGQAGVLPQELGYALMVEGFQAAAGDRASLDYGLSLLRAWVGLASAGSEASATGLASAHFGVLSTQDASSSTGVDADAVLGMIYLSEALGHPDDFVEMVVRAIIGFVSSDLGFPNLYRTLPDGTRLFVPKSGSTWGGLQPESGPHATAQAPWCYTPSSFAPAHLRTFRDFASQHWRQAFDAHLPPRQDESGTTLADLSAGFNASIVAGYNILYWSSCQSGAVSNWVGVKAPCPDGALACDGVPWASTPFVGEAGTCSGSGSPFGSFGPDAGQTPWRIALDYVLYPVESIEVPVYSRAGIIDEGLEFGSVIYLRRFATHYRQNAQCDGGDAESCLLRGKVAAFRLAHAFEPGAPSLTCEGVPNPGHDWWASFMSYPTFTAFVAPSDDLPREQSAMWLDNLASLCVFADGHEPQGYLCSFSYFELDQELVSTMIMAGAVQPLKAPSAVSKPPVDSAGRPPVDSASRSPVVDSASGPSSDALTPTSSRSSQDAAVEAFSSGEQEERTASEGSDQTDLFPAGNELIVEQEDQQAKMAKAAEEFRLAREVDNETAEAEAILKYDSAMTAWDQEQALRPRVQELEKEQSAEVVMEVDDARAVEAKEEKDQEEESKWAAEFQKAKERGDKKAEEKAVVTFEKAKESLEKDEAQQKRQDLQHREEEEALQQKEEALKEEIAEVALSTADQAEADARRFPRQDGLDSRQDAVPEGAPAPAAEQGFCCLHADSKNDFCGTCHPKAVTKPDSWCAQKEEHCLKCGEDAHWCHGPLLTGNSSGSLPIIEDASLRGSWELYAKPKATPALPTALLGLGLLVAAAGVARAIPTRGNHGYSLAAPQPLQARAQNREAEVAE